MFKVCIISCGMIANSAHIPAFKKFPNDYEIVAVCDINEETARETAQRHNIPRSYKNAEQMLDKEKPDVVSVCVPNCFHKEYTIMALLKGANVLCEKPLAFSKKDAVEMYKCAKRNNRLLVACQSMRFTPDRLAAKKYIKNDGLDEIYYGEVSRIRRRGIPTWGKFHMKKISCGGAFIDIGVHMIDALVWLMGNQEIKSVNGVAMQNHNDEIGSLVGGGALTGEVHNQRIFNTDEMDVEDFSCGMLNFKNGAMVSFKVAWATNMYEESSIKLVSKKFGIEIPTCRVLSGESDEKILKTEPCPYDTPFFGHIYIVDNLRKALKGEEELIIRPEETINVSSIIECFYKSVELGREVSVKELV